MTTITKSEEIQKAKTSLLEKLNDHFSNIKKLNHSYDQIIRVELQIDQADPLDWLQKISCKDKFYWRNRDDKSERAGFGIADIVTTNSRVDFQKFLNPINEKLSGSLSARYYGGFSFNSEIEDKSNDNKWSDFGSGRFVLPRFEIIRDNEITTLACNILSEEIGKINYPDLINILEETDLLPITTNSNNSFTRDDNPDHDGWVRMLTKADELIEDGNLDKIVLARCSTIKKEELLNPWEILVKFRDETLNCFLFGFQPGDGKTFIGASPELLFSRHNGMVKSEAIAGTKPRGKTESKDNEQASALTMSDKEQREHNWVVKAIDERLRDLCTNLNIDSHPSTLKLAKVQHLVTHFNGELKKNIKDSDLLTALHPTPAVGGYPNKQAIENIKELESFNRGWYAGPIGWIGNDSTEIAVGIRSALIDLNIITIYSGAGIVRGSTPEKEWNEIEAKMSHIEKMAFGASQ